MNMTPMKFYDTSSALLLQERIFEDSFFISYCTLIELEEIKVSANKDADIKAKARNLVRLLDASPDKYTVIMEGEEEVLSRGLKLTRDNIIIAGAYLLQKQHPFSPIEFYSDDLLCRLVASNVFGLNVKKASDALQLIDTYVGYKELFLTNAEIAKFYEDQQTNHFGCLINEYVVLTNTDIDVTEVYKWTNDGYVGVYNRSVRSEVLGERIKAKDVYQQMAIDSIMTNMITAISGEAGSGKTLLALSCAFNLIDSGKYDRLVVLFNPTQVRGASPMGFYSGDMINKALQTNIGNILISKLGDRMAVDILLQQNKLKLISMADERGYEVHDNEILWISECQNTTVDLLKLCLSRPTENAKVIIEGDFEAQVDNYAFENTNNGMKRAIEVLKGEDIFGYVKLKNVYRSRLADLVSKM